MSADMRSFLEACTSPYNAAAVNCGTVAAAAFPGDRRVAAALAEWDALDTGQRFDVLDGDLLAFASALATRHGFEKLPYSSNPPGVPAWGLVVLSDTASEYAFAVTDGSSWWAKGAKGAAKVRACRVLHAWRV